MNISSKKSYHPFIIAAFHLRVLPEVLIRQIPRSTLYDWQHRNTEEQFGYSWYCSNKHLFETLQAVAANNGVLKINKGLLRIIALLRFIKTHAAHIRHKIFNAAETLTANIRKIAETLGLRITLKWLGLSPQQYWQLLQKTRCSQSVFRLCRIKHPAQLLKKEIAIIKQYCSDARFIYWPLASLYHQIIRDKAARFCISTFYKYTSLLKLERLNACTRRKNHAAGIRAEVP